MDPLPGDMGDHLLPELARHDALYGNIGEGRGDADDVALGDLALEAEQQVGRREVEEMQRMRLHDLAVVQQPAQLLRRRRQRTEAGDEVHRLGGREQVAHRTDAAQALHRDRHFPVRPAPDERLEAAELDDVQPDLMNPIVVVEQDRHLAVALDAGDRLDGDAARASAGLGGFEFEPWAGLNRNASSPWPKTRLAPGNQIVEILPDGVGGRRAAGNEIVDAHHLVDGLTLSSSSGSSGSFGIMRRCRVGWRDRPRSGFADVEVVALRRQAAVDRAGADGDQHLALARNSRSTCTFSALQTPPSISRCRRGRNA